MPSNKNHNLLRNIQYIFVCVFFASVPFENFSPFMANFSVAKIAFIPYFAAMLLSAKTLFSRKFIKGTINSVLAMLLLMVFSSMINWNNSIFHSSLFLNIILFWALLNHFRSDERVFVDGLFWYAISVFFLAILSMMGVGLDIGSDGRITIFNNNSNELGIKAGIAFFSLLCYCLVHSKDKPIHKPYLLLMEIPILTLMLGTGSRTALAFLVLGFAFFVYFKPAKYKYEKLIWLILGAIIGFVGYGYIMQQESIIRRVEKTLEDGDLSGRDTIWDGYIEMIYDNPWFGSGFEGINFSPHNVFVEILVISGIIGFIPFILFLYKACKYALLYLRIYNVMLPCLLMVACFGMLLAQQVLPVKSFWIGMAYATSYAITNNHYKLDSTRKKLV